MDILMVAAELSPYARATPLADVIAEQSRAVAQLGHEVTIALPRYPSFEEHGLLVARRLTPIELPGGHSVTVFDGQLASGVKIALFDAAQLFTAPGVFGEGDEAYPNNAERFGLLCRAAAALSEQRREAGKPFDVVHLHDWPAASAAVLFRDLQKKHQSKTRVVLTVHDGYQTGPVTREGLSEFGITESLLAEYGTVPGTSVSLEGSLLGLGLVSADVVTVTSASHAAELSAAHSSSLSEVFSALDLVSIRSGIDYGIYNPATDPALRTRYDATAPQGKGANKAAVAERTEIEFVPARPLVVIAGELTSQGGFDLVLGALDELAKQDATFIVAGVPGARTASGTIVSALSEKNLPRDTYAFIERCSPDALRQLVAAADITVVPAEDVSLARWLRLAHRYGALPVCQASGTAADVVVDCDAELETGTGFLFEDRDATAVAGALGRALSAYRHARWPELVKRVMRSDLSWDQPARRYVQIYRRAAGV